MHPRVKQALQRRQAARRERALARARANAHRIRTNARRGRLPAARTAARFCLMVGCLYLGIRVGLQLLWELGAGIGMEDLTRPAALGIGLGLSLLWYFRRRGPRFLARKVEASLLETRTILLAGRAPAEEARVEAADRALEQADLELTEALEIEARDEADRGRLAVVGPRSGPGGELSTAPDPRGRLSEPEEA